MVSHSPPIELWQILRLKKKCCSFLCFFFVFFWLCKNAMKVSNKVQVSLLINQAWLISLVSGNYSHKINCLEAHYFTVDSIAYGFFRTCVSYYIAFLYTHTHTHTHVSNTCGDNNAAGRVSTTASLTNSTE